MKTGDVVILDQATKKTVAVVLKIDVISAFAYVEPVNGMPSDRSWEPIAHLKPYAP